MKEKKYCGPKLFLLFLHCENTNNRIALILVRRSRWPLPGGVRGSLLPAPLEVQERCLDMPVPPHLFSSPPCWPASYSKQPSLFHTCNFYNKVKSVAWMRTVLIDPATPGQAQILFKKWAIHNFAFLCCFAGRHFLSPAIQNFFVFLTYHQQRLAKEVWLGSCSPSYLIILDLWTRGRSYGDFWREQPVLSIHTCSLTSPVLGRPALSSSRTLNRQKTSLAESHYPVPELARQRGCDCGVGEEVPDQFIWWQFTIRSA